MDVALVHLLALDLLDLVTVLRRQRHLSESDARGGRATWRQGSCARLYCQCGPARRRRTLGLVQVEVVCRVSDTSRSKAHALETSRERSWPIECLSAKPVDRQR